MGGRVVKVECGEFRLVRVGGGGVMGESGGIVVVVRRVNRSMATCWYDLAVVHLAGDVSRVVAVAVVVGGGGGIVEGV